MYVWTLVLVWVGYRSSVLLSLSLSDSVRLGREEANEPKKGSSTRGPGETNAMSGTKVNDRTRSTRYQQASVKKRKRRLDSTCR